jgi:hypothetical protein
MWQTFESGVRHPGEDVTGFARRVTNRTRRRDSDRRAARATRRRRPDHGRRARHRGLRDHLRRHGPECRPARSKATTTSPHGSCPALSPPRVSSSRSYQHTAARLILSSATCTGCWCRWRRCCPTAPRTPHPAPRTPHSDPFLAARGWQARGGVYVRQPQADLKAGRHGFHRRLPRPDPGRADRPGPGRGPRVRRLAHRRRGRPGPQPLRDADH